MEARFGIVPNRAFAFRSASLSDSLRKKNLNFKEADTRCTSADGYPGGIHPEWPTVGVYLKPVAHLDAPKQHSARKGEKVCFSHILQKGAAKLVITHKLRMDLEGKEGRKWIEVNQWDTNTQQIRLSLFSQMKAWLIPADAAVMICYKKPDGTRGMYDTLSDGTAAWSAAGNKLTLELAPQMLTAAGTVTFQTKILQQEKVVHTFAVEIVVRPFLGNDKPANSMPSENYFYLTRVLPAPDNAKAGHFLKVSDVDSAGNVTRVEAVEIPGENADAEQVEKMIVEYLEAHPPQTGEKGDPGVYILGEGETVADAPENANVVIDPNGEPLVDLGGVKTVNGIEPDENGNIQIEAGSQSDWNAAEGEPGHIRNRPFCSQFTIADVLPETQAMYDAGEGIFAIPDNFPMESGKTYTVNWNGTPYVCTAETVEGFFPVPVCALGDTNAVIYGRPSGIAPFCMASLPDEFAAQFGAGTVIMPLDGTTSLTISVSGEVEKVEKLSGKYLPEGLPRSEFTNGTVLPETTGNDIGGAFLVEGECKLTSGQEYTVYWNGTPYVCTAYDFAWNGVHTVALGDENVLNGGEPAGTVPFGIMRITVDMGLMISDGVFAYPADGSKSLTISITGSIETITTIAEKFLPQGVRTYVVKSDKNRLEAGGTYWDNDTNFDSFAEILYNGGSLQVDVGGKRYFPAVWEYDADAQNLILRLIVPGDYSFGLCTYTFEKGSWTPPV